MDTDTKKIPLIYRNYIRWPLMFFMVAIVILGLMYSFFLNPVENPGAYSPCVFYKAFHLFCPGCGDSRALHALTHGHILQAFDYNLMFPFAAFILAWYYLVAITTLLFRRRVMWIPQTIPIWSVIAVGVGIVLFTVLRNIPVWPLTILAP
ncbi:MAG: DUF2752 domain-containing protein [Clostridiales bacterium]|nr:DUF2752 domain-containing protein [Clostridiales bacterium]